MVGDFGKCGLLEAENVPLASFTLIYERILNRGWKICNSAVFDSSSLKFLEIFRRFGLPIFVWVVSYGNLSLLLEHFSKTVVVHREFNQSCRRQVRHRKEIYCSKNSLRVVSSTKFHKRSIFSATSNEIWRGSKLVIAFDAGDGLYWKSRVSVECCSR